MKAYKLFLSLCFLFSFHSCTLAPPYYRTVDGIPESWRVESDEGSTIANMDWWEQLNDPVLDSLIQEALDHNKDLKIAIARVYEYYDILGEVRSFLLPEIGSAGSAERQELSFASSIVAFPAGAHRTSNLYTLFLNLSYELDVWGRIRSLTDAALSEYLGQIEARRTVILTLITSVADAYIQLRQYDKQLEIAINTYASRKESYELADLRFKGGLTSELEVKQAESEMESALVQVKELEILIPQQENLISVLIGHNPEQIARGLPIDGLDLPSTIPAGFPSDLLEQRPDIRKAEQEVIAANALIGAARAEFFPQISLTGIYGNESLRARDLFKGFARQWNYTAAYSVPLYNTGRTIFRVEASEMRKLEALYAYQEIVQTAFQEVDDALIALEKTKELVEVLTKQVSVLKDYLHLATLQYNNGQTDYLNVLDAERRLFAAQLDLAQAQGDSFLSFISLYKALGGGWVVAADSECIAFP